jgi:FAD/FMN-containing dehydrogenase
MGLGEAYLTPRLGYGADHLLAFELVTANGDVLNVTADEHPDLFWALRGAGANFGVVTALQLRLHPVPEHTVGGEITFDGADAERLTWQIWQVMEHGSEYFWPRFVYVTGASGDLQVRMIPGHTGPRELARRELDAFCEAVPPIIDDSRSVSYLDLIFDEPEQPPRREWDIMRFPFDADYERQITVLLDQLRTDDDHLTARRAIGLWRSVAPDVPLPGAAPRHQGISTIPVSFWEDSAQDAAELTWIERTTGTFREAGVAKEAGNAINHVSRYDAERVRTVYGREQYEQLAELKARYDPDNVFHRNFNISPAKKATPA